MAEPTSLRASGTLPLLTGAGSRRRSGRRRGAPRRSPLLRAVFVASLLAACGSPSATPTSAPATTPAGPTAVSTSPSAAPTQSATAAPRSFPLAVVAPVTDLRPAISVADLAAAIGAGTILVPCGLASLRLAGAPSPVAVPSDCVAADALTPRVRARDGTLALLPPGLVTPSVKVLQVGDADLFGVASHRSLPYPLSATATPDGPLSADATAYDATDVRTLVSTGDTCPDRGVSDQAVVLGKGWDWVLDGGTARYTGTHMTSFDWPAVDAVRTGDSGRVRALVSDADVAVDDFECPFFKGFVQHDQGTVFSIDPRVAPAMAKAGYDVVTLGSNHITDGGARGVRETLAGLDAAGIKHVGAGLDLAGALAPAVVDVRGVRFGFVGWDDIAGSGAAAPGNPGVAPMTDANVASSLAAARKVADVVIAMPQWGWPEYHADFTKQQLGQRAFFYTSGADHILGSGTHWAGALSVTPGSRGPQLAVTSHGNFLFDQSWSRQTEEGNIVEAAFVGTRLVQVRLHPYVVLDGAQPNLTNPQTDGAFVLKQVFAVSDIR